MPAAAAIPVLVLANKVKAGKKTKKGRTAKQKAATAKMIAANRARKKGAKSPATKKPKKSKKEKATMAKKPRTAKQKAATARMIAANKRKHGGGAKKAAKRPKGRKGPKSKTTTSYRRTTVRNPVDNPVEISRGMAAGQVAGGAVLGVGGAGGVDYMVGNTDTFSTPGPKAALHGGIALALLGLAVAVPKASPFFGTAGGAFVGAAGINLGKMLFASGSAPNAKTGKTTQAQALPNAGVPAAATQPPGLPQGQYLGTDGQVYMSGVVMGGLVLPSGGMGAGYVPRASRHDLRRMAGLVETLGSTEENRR
jgi:hypothetical protein